jgi:predicted metalloprotease
MSRRSGAGAVLAVCATLLIASCSTTLTGTAVSVFDDPFKVAGMPAVDGPTGLRPVPERPSRDVEDSDGGEIDELAASSISDIEDFWATAYPETFDKDFTPVKELISWDADGYESQEFCGLDTYGLENAGYCFLDHTIGWDRGELLPELKANFGDIAVTNVLAHEYGHAIQRQAKLKAKGAPTLVAEQQADCFAGAYMRWVAEDNSPRFTLSTGDGLNNVLAAMISFSDPLLTENEYLPDANEHGSAFERISAFQFGFTDGARSCAAIDEKEIAQRRGDLPVELQEDQTGEWPVGEESGRCSHRLTHPNSASTRTRRPPARTRGPVHRSHSARPPTRSLSTWPGSKSSARHRARAGTAVWCPGTTRRTRCSSPATCWPCSTSAVACRWTARRPPCEPHA